MAIWRRSPSSGAEPADHPRRAARGNAGEAQLSAMRGRRRCGLIALGLHSSQVARRPWSDRIAVAGLCAASLFASLCVLTVLRDLLLLALIFPLSAGSFHLVEAVSAAMVVALALAVTAVGLANARRRARIVDVDIPIAGLKSRYGTCFVTGNHEYYCGEPAWRAELGRLGMRVLANEHIVVRHHGTPIVVAGVTDFSAERFDAGQKSDPEAALRGAPGARILLAHQPRTAPAAARAGFDLQLSGHTHGGQFWPWMHFVRFQQPYTAGLHRLGRLWVYTSRGTGYWGPPQRFGAPSESTRLRIVPLSAGPRATHSLDGDRAPPGIRAPGRRRTRAPVHPRPHPTPESVA